MINEFNVGFLLINISLILLHIIYGTYLLVGIPIYSDPLLRIIHNKFYNGRSSAYSYSETRSELFLWKRVAAVKEAPGMSSRNPSRMSIFIPLSLSLPFFPFTSLLALGQIRLIQPQLFLCVPSIPLSIVAFCAYLQIEDTGTI